MANQKIFCNTPWYEAHIYWDGSLGICCQESHKLYTDESQEFNIKNMSLLEWFNSSPVRKFRQDISGNTSLSVCSRCYNEETLNGTSRRHRSNQKSVIFTSQAFQESFAQSPGYPHFDHSQNSQGLTNTLPIDLHIDLGNHCNLACKMCWSGASSQIASQMVKWGFDEHKKYLGVDWTKDTATWQKFLQELNTIPNLKNIHLMGGETLLSPRFEELVDWMILHQRFDVCFSFVTNGTVYKPELINKLKQFDRVGIEISIETATLHNDYVRQGSQVQEVLSNIKKYQELCDGPDQSVTLRPAISLLTIGYYHTLLRYCLENKLLIKSLVVTNPDYLHCSNLPLEIRTQYKLPYENLLNELSQIDITGDFNESDTNNLLQSIKQQTIQVLSLLNSPTDKNIAANWVTAVEWMRKWDSKFGFNVRELYPEFNDILDSYEY